MEPMLRHIFEDLPGRPEVHLPDVIRTAQAVNVEGKLYRVESTELLIDTKGGGVRVYVRTRPLIKKTRKGV